MFRKWLWDRMVLELQGHLGQWKASACTRLPLNAEEHYNQLVELEGGLEVEQKQDKAAWGKNTLDLRN